MALSTVNGKLVNPAEAATVGGQVSFTLVTYDDQPAAGFDTADSVETIDTVTATPALDGTWSVNLVPNANIQLFDGQSQTAYRVVESSSGALSTYWIVVTAVSPAWVGSLRTALVGPSAPAQLPGTWCSVTDVLTYTGQSVTQIHVTIAQQMMEGLIRRVWRSTDASRRDYYWLQRATAWQAFYVSEHPELLSMMDVQSISQDGMTVVFRGSSQPVQLYSPIALRFLSNLFRGSNGSIRFNSAFQKNRLTKVGVTAGSSVPWNNL